MVEQDWIKFNQEELNQTSKILWLKAITSPLSHVFFLILISFFNFFFSLKIIGFQNLKTISKTKVFNDASKTFIRNIFRDWNWSFKKT